MLLLMRGIAWVALHTPPPVASSSYRNSTVAHRLLFALEHAAEVNNRTGQLSGDDIFEGFDRSHISRNAQLAPADDAIAISLTAIDNALDDIGVIFNPRCASTTRERFGRSGPSSRNGPEKATTGLQACHVTATR